MARNQTSAYTLALTCSDFKDLLLMLLLLLGFTSPFLEEG